MNDLVESINNGFAGLHSRLDVLGREMKGLNKEMKGAELSDYLQRTNKYDFFPI